MQNRVTYLENEGEDGSYDGQTPSFAIDGYVGTPKLLYAIQLSFALVMWVSLEGENINIIQDAVVLQT
jgi:hypothetical protein